MPAIIPIPTSRTSDMLLRNRLLSQMQFQQLDLFKVQQQLSTGRRVSSPSEDAPASLRAIGLQRLLEQKEQARTNLKTSQSYLSATDHALSGVGDLLADIRGAALAAADTTTGRTQRRAVAQQVDAAIAQFIDIGNRKFRGRYLLAGSITTVAPFEGTDQFVVYHGNRRALPSFVDTDLLMDTNVDGDEVFGALSAAAGTSADLNPILTPGTRLADLHGGLGVSKGTFTVSDGVTSSTIDISSAETVEDVVRLIEDSPPSGRTVTAQITATGLVIDIDDAGGGNLTINEVGGGTTAAQLGILESAGTGIGPVVGADLDPALTLTTPLDDLLSGAFDKGSGIRIVNGGETFTVQFQDAETVEDMLNALNGSGADVVAEIAADRAGISVRSRRSGADFQIGENGGTTATELGIRTFTRETLLAEFNHGIGVATLDGTDFTIRRKDGVELQIDVSPAATVGDVLDAINNHPDNLDPATAVAARLKTVGNGIELVDANAAGSDTLTVTRVPRSQAAVDLGLVPRGELEVQAEPGSPEVISGIDASPLEVKGVFNSLLRLNQAIAEDDVAQIERAIGMLDDDLDRLSFTRADIGMREQQMDVLKGRLEDEKIELTRVLSEEIDADLVEAATALTARQASFEASLRTIAATLQMTLLNFL